MICKILKRWLIEMEFAVMVLLVQYNRTKMKSLVEKGTLYTSLNLVKLNGRIVRWEYRAVKLLKIWDSMTPKAVVCDFSSLEKPSETEQERTA